MGGADSWAHETPSLKGRGSRLSMPRWTTSVNRRNARRVQASARIGEPGVCGRAPPLSSLLKDIDDAVRAAAQTLCNAAAGSSKMREP